MARNNSIQVFRGGWKELEDSVFTDNETTITPLGSTNSFCIKPDGTELYILDDNIVRTFPLAIPYDPNSIGAEIRSFPIPGSDDTTPRGITFQEGEFQGTQMFIGGSNSKVMLAYSLPVPFDTSSIVASPASLSLSVISGTLVNHKFSRDGDFFFTTSMGPPRVHRFPLPTPWDITSNTSSSEFDPVLGAVSGIDFKPQGDIMYILDITVSEVVAYGLTTPFDTSTATKNGDVLDFAPNGFQDFKFRSTGKEILFLDTIGTIVRFHVDEAWNVSTASHFTNEFDIGTGTNFAVTWKPDGTSFFILDGLGASRDISQYDVPNRFNQTGAVFVGSFSLALFDGNNQAMYWRKTGLECYFMTVGTRKIIRLDLTTAWDITTMFDPGVEKFLVGDLNQIAGLYIRDDGLKAYMSDQAGAILREFDMLPAWDITTLVLLQTESITVTDQLSGVFWKQDGRLLFLLDRRNVNLIMMFEVSTPWDISTIVFVTSFDVDAQQNNVRGLFIREDNGMKLYFLGTGNDIVYSIDMSLEFNNTIITNFGDELVTNAGDRLVYN